MATANSMYHSSLSNWWSGYAAVAENIAWVSRNQTAGQVHINWMRSSGHRRNILAPNVNRIGVGVICAHGRLWATQRFASTSSANFGGTPSASPLIRSDRGSGRC